MRPVTWKIRTFARRGFTLIELLVAVGIFVILLGITVGTLQSTRSADKVRESSRVMQAFFEGARSRAFKTERAVGVRLLLDKNDFTIATGLIYVSERAPIRGKLVFPSASDPRLIRQSRSGANRMDLRWFDLSSRGELLPSSPSVKMQIPPPGQGGSPRTYFIDTENFANLVTTDRLRLASDYHQNPLPTTPIDYELTLSPTVIGDPVPLAKGTVIDLRSSYDHLPSPWRNVFESVNGDWQASTTYTIGDWVRSANSKLNYQCIQGGTSGSSDPFTGNEAFASTVPETGGTGVVWQVFDTPHFDIMFSPRGSVVGRESAAGIISFVVADRDSLFSPDTGRRRVIIQDTDPDTDNGLNEFADAEGKLRLLNIFTQSGLITTSPLDLTDGDSNNFADNIFNFAVNGSEAQ